MVYVRPSDKIIKARKKPEPIKLSKKEKALRKAIEESKLIEEDGCAIYEVMELEKMIKSDV